MCHSRLHSPFSHKTRIFIPTLHLAELSTLITGYEPRIQFAISFTAEQIFRAQFQQAQIEGVVQRPQIEIQPTTGAIVE